MARLEPFLKGKGYPDVVSEELGSSALTRLESESYHLVLLDLILGDIELRDFFLEARRRQGDAAFILFASPAESEMVVSGLVLGADAYVPLPPDEDELFFVLERHGTAALSRKAANPEAQPGVPQRVQALEGELAAARAQLTELEEQNRLLDAEVARLNKVLDEARKTPSAEATVPAGHKVVAEATLEELESRASFVEFLESENDEIKKERDALLTRLKALGEDMDDDEGGFDEPTSAILIEDDALPFVAPGEAPGPAISPVDPLESLEGGPVGEELLLDDGGDELLIDTDGVELLLDDEGGEDEAVTLAIDVEEPATPSPSPVAAEPLPFEAPPTMAEPAPVPPPIGDEEPADDYDDFEDVNTDALLRLAGDLTGDGPSADELEKLLASLDED